MWEEFSFLIEELDSTKKVGEKMKKKKKKKKKGKEIDWKRKEGRHWLHEKSCYRSWRFTRGDRADWPLRNIAASQKGRCFRVKLALDDGTSPTFHAVTRMDSRSRYFTSRHFPIADHRVYPPPRSLPSRFFYHPERDGLPSFLSESMDGDGTWREDPLTSSVCSKNFLLCKSFLCMTIRLNFYSFSSSLFLKIFEPFQILLNISKRLHLDFQNFDFLQVSTKIR